MRSDSFFSLGFVHQFCELLNHFMYASKTIVSVCISLCVFARLFSVLPLALSALRSESLIADSNARVSTESDAHCLESERFLLSQFQCMFMWSRTIAIFHVCADKFKLFC